MRNKQYLIGCMPNIFVSIVLAGILAMGSCRKTDVTELVTSSEIIHNYYNDTIQLVPLFTGYEVPSIVTDSFLYDVNNDRVNDLVIANRIEYMNAVQLIGIMLYNGHMEILTRDSLYYSNNLKSFRTGEVIAQDSFYRRANANSPYNIYYANPSSFLPTLSITNYDPVSWVFYYVFMDDNISSTKHHYAWLKLKFGYDPVRANSHIIVMESGYNNTPLESIEAGQY